MSEIKHIIQLFFFLLIQIFILNEFLFLGYANPMLYLLFFITFPYRETNIIVLLYAFFAGILLDSFSDTGGIYAASTLLLVYIRPIFIRFFFGKNFDYQSIKLNHFPISTQILFVLSLVFIHHFSFYFLEIFNLNHLADTFIKITTNTIITTLVCVLSIQVFSKKKN